MKRHDDTQQYTRITIGEAFIVNPSRPLKKGTITPFIPMETLSVNGRAIERYESRRFTGSGARFKNGDTLIARITPCLENGKTAFVSELPEGVIAHGSTEYIVLSAREGITDPLFGYYLARTPDFRQYAIGHMEGTSGRQRVPTSAVENYEILLPPIDTQRSISRILGALDDKIELHRRTNQTLESIAQAIFKSWFIDFDPVKAKIAALEEGEDPLRAAMRAISGKTDDELDQLPRKQYDELAETGGLFPDAMEESELGEIPAGWKVDAIGNLVETTGGATPDTKNQTYWRPAAHNWTTPKDLSNLEAPVLLSTERKISDAGLSKISSGLLPTGTLLMSSRAPIGYLAITQMPVAINQGYIAMLPGGKLPPLYLLMWCRENMDMIKGQANGSTFMEISKKAFRPLPALIPPVNIIARHLQLTTPFFKQIISKTKEAQITANLRNLLLPKLLSNEPIKNHYTKPQNPAHNGISHEKQKSKNPYVHDIFINPVSTPGA